MLPPFTDLRSVQTLVDGDRLEIRYGAQDVSHARRRRLHRRDLRRRCWPSSAAPTSWSATPSGASTTPSPTRPSTPRRRRRSPPAITPIVCVGEGLEVRQEGRHVEHTLAQLDGSLAGSERRAGRRAWWSPTSRCGRSAPARWPPPTTPRRSAPRSAARVAEAWSEDAARRRPRSCTAARSRPPTSPGSWRRPTSTAPRRRREPAARRVRRHLPVLRHARHLTVPL